LEKNNKQKTEREKREYTETVSSVVKIIIAFLVMIHSLLLLSGEEQQRKPPAPVILPIPTVAINYFPLH
jgi:hypothetical protein